jgi:hypothetical protein
MEFFLLSQTRSSGCSSNFLLQSKNYRLLSLNDALFAASISHFFKTSRQEMLHFHSKFAWLSINSIQIPAKKWRKLHDSGVQNSIFLKGTKMQRPERILP